MYYIPYFSKMYVTVDYNRSNSDEGYKIGVY
jgi:hypothetical protein